MANHVENVPFDLVWAYFVKKYPSLDYSRITIGHYQLVTDIVRMETWRRSNKREYRDLICLHLLEIASKGSRDTWVMDGVERDGLAQIREEHRKHIQQAVQDYTKRNRQLKDCEGQLWEALHRAANNVERGVPSARADSHTLSIRAVYDHVTGEIYHDLHLKPSAEEGARTDPLAGFPFPGQESFSDLPTIVVT